MEHEEQLEWERRWGTPAAIVAAIGAIVTIAPGFYMGSALKDQPRETDDLLVAASRYPEVFRVQGVLFAVASLLLIPVLIYLFRCTRYRRSQMIQVALVLAIIGPVIYAVLQILRVQELISAADSFIAAHGGAISSTKEIQDQAEDVLTEGNLSTIRNVLFGAGLAVGVSILAISLNAMRAGLLSRFIGILGIIIGVLYALPISGGPQILQLFWLGALAMLFADRWPGKRGPAWDSGVEEAWPSAAVQRAAALEEARAAKEGAEAPEVPVQTNGHSLELESGDNLPAPNKRKRKRR